MAEMKDFLSRDEIAWCPGCGDFGILNGVKKALVALGKAPKDVLLVSGIGQAAKLPHYIRCNCFNGLHGRALPAAAGAKMANPRLTVIVTTGDGDCYGEGGNHLIHNIRRNLDITLVVHNNQIYGLTKGQPSPTTDAGTRTRIQPDGVVLEPMKALEMAIALGCGFVARGFSKDSDHLSGLIQEGVRHKGFSLIEVLQPCVIFNKVNTYEWYAQRIYKVDEDPAYKPEDRVAALAKAAQWGEKIPTGILYRAERPSYEELTGLDRRTPPVDEDIGHVDIQRLLESFR